MTFMSISMSVYADFEMIVVLISEQVKVSQVMTSHIPANGPLHSRTTVQLKEMTSCGTVHNVQVSIMSTVPEVM